MPNTPSIFLINSDTFKKSFLSGSGQFELQSDQNIWATLIANDGKFLPTIDRIADVNFSFGNNQQFKLGNQAGMKTAAEQLNKEWAGSGTRAHFISDYYTAISSNQKPLGPFDAWVRQQGEKDEDVGSHAGIKDTSTLMAVEALDFKKGELVRWDKLAPRGGSPDSGVSGNPARASVAYGKKGLELQVDAAVKEITAAVAKK